MTSSNSDTPPSSEQSTEPADKLWGGRFTEATDAFVEVFTASVSFDQRLYRQDITGSIAHANMLAHVGVLTTEEAAVIVAGLTSIHKDIEAGQFDWRVDLEDVHMNIEAALTEKIGAVGKKLHTGRSRNDQVATDIRLYLRDELDAIDRQIGELQSVLLDLAERNTVTVMPGFTHLQAAQPVTFGHHILAWFEMLTRDRARFADCRGRTNVLPLGAAALAGTTFPIDRQHVADALGFSAIAANSLDAVSDRDFAIEFTAASSLMMMHFSRWCEELVLWTSQQFGFINLPDRFCTGSSIMPQKKNPDVPELIRGKTGRVYGHLTSLLTLMKSQPLAYNKDNQEDKEPLFDAVDTVRNCLTALTGMLAFVETKPDVLADAAGRGYSTATDLADYLVRNGVAFRDSHDIVGRVVAAAVARGCALDELSDADFAGISNALDSGARQVLSLQASVAARNHFGGTAPEQVRLRIAAARAALD